MRDRPLVERKEVLRAIVPARSPYVLYAQHVARRSREFFAEVCRQNLEGIVAKRAESPYRPLGPATWIKVKNRDYTQARDRHEPFERRTPRTHTVQDARAITRSL